MATKTAKKKETPAATKAANTESVTKASEGRPSVEPTDPAPGKPKIDEDAPAGQKVAGGGGSNVYAGHPLVKGIPVVVPVNDSIQVDVELVEGLAVAAAVVPGAPEMVANAQAEYSVENQTWEKGDIKSFHENQGELQIDVVQDDGTVKTERHRADA